MFCEISLRCGRIDVILREARRCESARPNRRPYPETIIHKIYRSIGLFIFISVLAITPFAQSSPDQPPTITVGQPVERELRGGQTHAYQSHLDKGQYLFVVVDQLGIDIELKLYRPDGQILVVMDSPNNTQGPETASLITEQSGAYRIEVKSLTDVAPKGQYRVRIETIRPATDTDRRWVSAQKTYLEGQQLQAQGTAESRQKAIEKYQEAARGWQSIGDRVMETHAHLSAGGAWSELGQLQKALENYNEALKLQQSGLGQSERPYTLYTIGVVYYGMGETRRSLEYYQQALSQQRETADIYAEAETLGSMGVAYSALGDIAKALEIYSQALSVWQKMGNRPRQALTSHNIGRAYEVTGDLQKALERYFQSLAIYRSLRDRDGEAEELNGIGFVYAQLGEWSKAIEYYNQALTLWRLTGDRRREAILLANIGAAYASLNDPAKALEKYRQAIEIHHSIGNRRSEAVALERIGDLYEATSDSKDALGHYEKALELRRLTGDRLGEASTLAAIGILYNSLGDRQKALEFLILSLGICQAAGDKRVEARVLYNIARVERGRGNLDEARRRIEEALSKVEAVRANAGSQQLRASYLATVQKYYELHTDLLMRLHVAHPNNGYDALAIEANERARARSLLEMLKESRVDIRQGVDKKLLERERDISALLNTRAQRQLQLSGRSAGDKQLTAIKQEISTLEDEYQQVQTAIRQSSPHYAAITQPQPLSLKEIQKELDGDVLLLEYALGEGRSYLWAVTNHSITSHELPAREEIEKVAKNLYQLITERSRLVTGESRQQRLDRIARADSQLPEAASRLSSLVISPIAASLGNRRLVIVADGALQYIPFAMLPGMVAGSRLSVIGDRSSAYLKNRIAKQLSTTGYRQPAAGPRPLILDHEIIYLPSASTLAIQRRELAGRKSAPKQIAVIADPVFSQNDVRLKTGAGNSAADRTGDQRSIDHDEEGGVVTVGGFAIQRLPFTRREAELILKVSPDKDNLKALDFNASRATITGADLSQYRYLHFATHGLLDSERPGLSALVLSLVDSRGRSLDGFLRANEIYNLNLPADLVVLSACQTGLGKEIRGEGLVGLTRGFMYAGAARVVVSLWNVSDRATSELMANFYRQMLKNGQRPAAALRSAQVELLTSPQWKSPYYWAGFVIQGEWR